MRRLLNNACQQPTCLTDTSILTKGFNKADVYIGVSAKTLPNHAQCIGRADRTLRGKTK